jgi:hypothetical protein
VTTRWDRTIQNRARDLPAVEKFVSISNPG